MLTYDPSIEQEIEAASTIVVDLYEIDFGYGLKKYWSNQMVDSSWYPQVEFGAPGSLDQPTAFTPRILECSGRSWSMDYEDSHVTLRVAYKLRNDDTEIEQLIHNYGVDIFERANIYVHRLFPNVKQIVRNYWYGLGNAPVFHETEFEWDIGFAPTQLHQTCGRYIQAGCMHEFADDIHCRYNLDKKRGIPQAVIEADTINPTSNTQITLTNGVKTLPLDIVGWYVHSRELNIYGRITKRTGDYSCDIQFLGGGTSEDTGVFANDVTVQIGPAFTSCGRSRGDCGQRGMYGIASTTPVGAEDYVLTSKAVSDKRRYFGGFETNIGATFSGRSAGKHGVRFVGRIPEVNSGMSDLIVPIIYGRYRLHDVPALYYTDEGTFRRGYFVLGEGRLASVATNFCRVAGRPPADNNTKNTLLDRIKEESYAIFGMYDKNPDPGLKATIATVNDALAYMRGAGARSSYGTKQQYEFDVYGYGEGVGHPYIFAVNEKIGPSWACITAAAVRIAVDEKEATEDITGVFDVEGLPVRLPSWVSVYPAPHTDNRFEITVNGQTLRWTVYPSPAIVLFDLLTNKSYGAGISENKLDLITFANFHEYCQHPISDPVQAPGRPIESFIGTVIWASANEIHTKSFEVGDNIATNALTGATIRFGSNFVAKVTGNQSTQESRPGEELGGVINVYFDEALDYWLKEKNKPQPLSFLPPFVQYQNLTSSEMITKIQIDVPFTKDTLPEPPSVWQGRNQSFVITNAGGSAPGEIVGRRWQANGVIFKPEKIGVTLSQTLEEFCAGYRISQEGKIQLVWRRAISESEMADLVTNRLFTDRGTKRNIVRNDDGTTTLKLWRKEVADMPNSYSVEFPDSSNNYITTKVTVYSDELQQEAAIRFGDVGARHINEKTVELPFTTTINQAARRLAVMVREDYITNLYCSFTTSLKGAVKVQPGDLIALDSELLSRFNVASSHISGHESISYSGGIFFFRVLTKDEESPYSYTYTGKVHVNGIYDDKVATFDEFFTVTHPTVTPNTDPRFPVPHTPTVEHELTAQNKLATYIKVGVDINNAK